MEPERRIEKWLRAFAKKRREQAGPMELPPATRQQLQREIARRADEKNRGGFFSAFFSSLRLRVAFAVCFIALAIGVLILLPEFTRHQPATLSMNKLGAAKISKDEAAHATPPPPAANAPTPVTTPPPVSIASISGEDKKVQVQTAPSVAPAPQPTAPSETREQADRAKNTLASREVAVTTAASAPATNNIRMFAYKNETTADSIAAAGALKKDAGGSLQAIPPATNFATGATLAENQKTIRSDATVQAAANLGSNTALYDTQSTALATTTPTTSQMFNRSEPATTRQRLARTAAATAPVLTSFRVEQSGNHMKVVDADGSVYTGSVQIVAQQQPAFDSTASKSAPAGGTIPAARRAAPAQAQAQQNYSFRVAGTNRALNQNIIFSGNFVPLTNSQLAGIAPGARADNGTGNVGGGGGFGGIRGGAIGGGAPPAGFVNNSAAAPALDTPLLNSGINGTITIGDQKAIDVIATPAH